MKKISKSAEETQRIAEDFSKTLKSGDILMLIGELGAGKTCFVQGLAHGLGVSEKTYVRSPSFALINEYKGKSLDLYHFDFYRLENPSDLDTIGVDEYLFGNGVCAIEWADRFPEAFPDNSYEINFQILDDETRELEFTKRDGGGINV